MMTPELFEHLEQPVSALMEALDTGGSVDLEGLTRDVIGPIMVTEVRGAWPLLSGMLISLNS